MWKGQPPRIWTTVAEKTGSSEFCVLGKNLLKPSDDFYLSDWKTLERLIPGLVKP